MHASKERRRVFFRLNGRVLCHQSEHAWTGSNRKKKKYLGKDTHGQLWIDVTRLDELVQRVDQRQTDATRRNRNETNA